MTDNGLPCLDLLEATPGILRGLMSELTDGDARWKPAPDRFSVAEVLAHLSHSEGHCYRMRVGRFLAETRPTFEPDDAQMYLTIWVISGRLPNWCAPESTWKAPVHWEATTS